MVDPSPELVDLVFPNLLRNAKTVTDPNYEHKKDVCGATKEFIDLVKNHLAPAFLQDVAVMWVDLKGTGIWRKSPFNTELFEQFVCVTYSSGL